MDNGLIQILVIAFFVIISMMDGAARKKRQKDARLSKGGLPGGMAEREELFPEEPGELFPQEPGELFPQEPEATSEGMVPHELWEEIAALARGGPPPSARRLPRAPSPEVEPTSGVMDAYEPEATRLDPVHQHVEAHDHVEWEPEDEPASGTMPERVETPPAADLDETAGRTRRAPGPARAVRRTLMRGGHESIRQAVILSEVLGPPVALRDSDHEPPG